MALIPKFFQDSIVAIGVPSGISTNWIGTGFLYGHHDTGDQYIVGLVTNKHVLNGQKVVCLRFDRSTGGTLSFNINLQGPNQTTIWTGHPDPEVDVAVLPIDANVLIRSGAHFGVFKSDQNVLPLSGPIAQSHLTEGDGIFVMGFPMGLVDVQANIAITRQGSIARIRDCLAGRSKSFLVDSPVYPGNSGGPVILKPEVVALQGTQAISKAYLIGIVASYIPYIDAAVSRQTGRSRISFEENSGLTNVFPVDAILQIYDIILRRGQVAPAQATAATEQTPT